MVWACEKNGLVPNGQKVVDGPKSVGDGYEGDRSLAG